MGRWWRYKWITFHPSLTGKADHLILLQNTKVVKIAVGSLRL
ncbi:transferase [Salmonella enterica]|nr:transferase [Salmonella enterica]